MRVNTRAGKLVRKLGGGERDDTRIGQELSKSSPQNKKPYMQIKILALRSQSETKNYTQNLT